MKWHEYKLSSYSWSLSGSIFRMVGWAWAEKCYVPWNIPQMESYIIWREIQISKFTSLKTRVDDEHAHDHIFKLKFLQQKSCLLNHAQVQYELCGTNVEWIWPTTNTINLWGLSGALGKLNQLEITSQSESVVFVILAPVQCLSKFHATSPTDHNFKLKQP